MPKNLKIYRFNCFNPPFGSWVGAESRFGNNAFGDLETINFMATGPELEVTRSLLESGDQA